LDNHRKVIRFAKYHPPSYFHHPPALSSLIDLGIAQLRVHETSRLRARATRTPCGWEWFRDTVVEKQRGNVGRKFITGKERGLTISASFALPDKGLSRFFAALRLR
jgi:hypothetical protein